MKGYDETYRRTASVFGEAPESMLVRFADRIAPEKVFLDVGCGQGRNTIWLAQQGFRTVGLDPSPVAVAELEMETGRRQLCVDTVCGGFHEMPEPVEAFGGICVFGLLQILPRDEIGDLIDCLGRWSTTASVLFVSAWSEKDPSFEKISRSWTQLERGSFRHRDGRVRTFLAAGEILDLFPRWVPIHHWEGMGPWHRHGDSPRERHGRVELVAERR